MKRITIALVATAILLTVIFVSINKTANPSAYFPLLKGCSWEYQGSGNEYASFKREVLYTKDNYAQISENNGGTELAAVYEISKEQIIRVYFEGESYNAPNLLTGSFTPNDSTIIMEKPLQKGHSWTDGENQREIIDLNANVVTPAGMFKHCLQIRLSGKDYHIDEYYAKDVGLIKREYVSGDYKVLSILEKYNIP